VTAEGTDFLYPFIEADEHDAGPLLIDLAASAQAKSEESARLSTLTRERNDALLTRAARAMIERFALGGRLFVFGNGGSATDAAGIVGLFASPPWGRPLPARSLAAERAVLTALGNDIGFELVFSRQLMAYARAGDMALGVSTSGNSTNLLNAFEEASRRGMATFGLAGYDGGQMGLSPAVEHCLVVSSSSVHRVQEAQAALSFDLWSRVQDGFVKPAP
jgi:D-sedoheptulose 7-phosphate isomerase